MAPSRRIRPDGTDRVRAQILTALHFGRLAPGDRAPSVRQLARDSGLNRKTIHRAYRHLAEEGLLEPRPGSGTFVAPEGGAGIAAPPPERLLQAVSRLRSEARELGLPPQLLASFLSRFVEPAGSGRRIAVVECNREQIGLIERDLHRQTPIATRSVLLGDLLAHPARVLHGMEGIVTTDCHAREVAEAAAGTGLPVWRVALDPSFPREIVRAAAQADVLLVVCDAAFAPVFLRLMVQTDVPPAVLRRIRIAEPLGAREAFTELPRGAGVCVSPTVERVMARRIPARFRLLPLHWRIEPASLDRLRAQLAFLQAAVRQPGTGEERRRASS